MNKQVLSPFDCDMCAMVEDLTKQVVEVTASPDSIRVSWEQPRCERNSPDDQRNRAIKQAVDGRLGKRVISWEYQAGRQNVYFQYDPEQYPEEYRTRLAAIDPKAGSRFCRTLKEVDAIQVRRDNREELERFTGGGTMTIPRTPDGRAVYSFNDGNGVFMDASEYFYIIRDAAGRYEVRNKQAFDVEFEPKGTRTVGNYEPTPRWRLRGANMIVSQRQKQIQKGRTPEYDSKENPAEELTRVAAALALDDVEMFKSSGWSLAWWEKVKERTFTERLAIAGALLAAEIDAQDYDNRERCENCEKELPADLMLHDTEGVPLCRECYDVMDWGDGGVSPCKYDPENIADCGKCEIKK